MGPNFTHCSKVFNDFSSHNGTYNFTGKVYGIFSDPAKRPPLITYEGCKQLCGTGTAYYGWADMSPTITTWVMVMAKPIITYWKD